MRILGLIPARGGSKGIPRKNLADLGGRPLISYTVEAALAARSLSAVAVSSEDAAIGRTAESLGAVWIQRPAELAGDRAQVIDAALHALETLEASGQYFDALALLQATSPFRTAAHIDEAVRQFESSKADSLLSVHKISEHPCEAVRRDGARIVEALPRPVKAEGRQNFPEYFYVNGAIYLTRTAVLRADKAFWNDSAELYAMPPIHGVDIDEPEQLETARALLSGHPRLSALRSPAGARS